MTNYEEKQAQTNCDQRTHSLTDFLVEFLLHEELGYFGFHSAWVRVPSRKVKNRSQAAQKGVIFDSLFDDGNKYPCSA